MLVWTQHSMQPAGNGLNKIHLQLTLMWSTLMWMELDTQRRLQGNNLTT